VAFFLTHQKLFHTGTRFDLGADAGLGLGCCEGGYTEGERYKGRGGYDYDFFHGDSPF
jgi:hypothetical protein